MTRSILATMAGVAVLTGLLSAATLPAGAQEQGAKVQQAAPKRDAVAQAREALAAADKLQQGPARLRALGKAAGRLDKRRQVEAISTDAMHRLGELVQAQEKLCASMQLGGAHAKENQTRAQMVADLTTRMQALIEETLAPLWSQLPLAALRAGRLDFASVHARFEAADSAHERAVAACRGKLHDGGKDAAESAAVDLRKAYEAAFEAGVAHALTRHKRLSRAEQDLELALRGLPEARSGAVEARLRAAIEEAVKK